MKGIDNILKPLYDLWHKVMDKLSVKDDVLLVDGKEVVVKMIVENIKQLSDSQCNELQCGDIVAKKTGNMFHLYQVTYKEDKHGICLTYQAAGLQETQSYDYIEGHWVYNSEDWVETDVTNAPSGTIVNVLGLDSNNKLVKGVVSSGTKLYKHLLFINSNFYVIMFSTSNVNINSAEALFNNRDYFIQKISTSGSSTTSTILYELIYSGMMYFNKITITSNAISLTSILVNTVSDTVTEL